MGLVLVIILILILLGGIGGPYIGAPFTYGYGLGHGGIGIIGIVLLVLIVLLVMGRL